MRALKEIFLPAAIGAGSMAIISAACGQGTVDTFTLAAIGGVAGSLVSAAVLKGLEYGEPVKRSPVTNVLLGSCVALGGAVVAVLPYVR